MYNMMCTVLIAKYELKIIESISIKKSVEQLADTAIITLPGSYINKTFNLENILKQGDPVTIMLGYEQPNGRGLLTEFTGFLNAINTDNATINLECEDSIYLFRKGLTNKEYNETKLEILVQDIVQQIDPSYTLDCDYEFVYKKFVVNNTTGWDVLKKLQEELKANIYFKDKILHIHPQYKKIMNQEAVEFDFSVNVEKSSLKYKTEDQRKYEIEVTGIISNGTLSEGTLVKATVGKMGGDKRSVMIGAVSGSPEEIKAMLIARGKEEMATVAYEGYEGNFTTWLLPYCEPSYKVSLFDPDYPAKDSDYYVVATDTKFSAAGGARTVTLGMKLGDRK